MRRLRWLSYCLLLSLLLTPAAAAGKPLPQAPPPDENTMLLTPLGTAFTYQGYLEDGEGPVADTCDFRFSLYGSAAGADQIGTTQTKTAGVNAGQFTVADLDFGTGAFQGEARYLKVEVRCPAGTGNFTALTPRQMISAAPYAQYALTAPWSGLAGIPGDFADGVDDNTTYTPGAGLTLETTTFSIAPGYRLPQTCANGQIAAWNGSGWSCANNNGGPGGDFWSLWGNAGTVHGVHFLGTTDNVTLTLAVSSTTGLRLAFGNFSPNLLGGSVYNLITVGVSGATIGGGGAEWGPNRVTDNLSTVGGGFNNQAGNGNGIFDDADVATVGGGANNVASGGAATVAGGAENTASGEYNATVGGGYFNTASATDATVSGGNTNTAGEWAATVSGGHQNSALEGASTVGGGVNNLAAGGDSVIAGGNENAAYGWAATISGGFTNTVTADAATIGGGFGNLAAGPDATVAGGKENRAEGEFAVIGGGRNNTANGDLGATIGGGADNTASGEAYATVAGGWNNNALGGGATVGGGAWNMAEANLTTVSGGESNAAQSTYATIGGGANNVAYEWASTIGGGQYNEANGSHGAVAGGESNRADGAWAAAGGGFNNTASGEGAAIPGGGSNFAGGDYSFAAGLNARAEHHGTFVWSDNTGGLTSTGDNQFLISAAGGVGIGTANPSGQVHIAANSNERAVYLSGGPVISATSLTVKWNLPPTSGAATLPMIAADWDTGGGYGIIKGDNVASPVVWMYGSTGRNAFTIARKSYGGSGADVTDIDDWLTPLVQVRENGYMGIGTTDPSHKLTISNGSNNNLLRLIGPLGDFGHGGRLNFGDGDRVYLDEDEDDKLTIYAQNRIAMMGSNVGIGTTTPQAALHVQGNILGSASVGIGTTSPQATLHVEGNTYNSGSLGVGETTPLRPLHITDAGPYVRFEDTDGGNAWENGVFGQDTDYRIAEIVGGSQNARLVIEEGGNVGIGTTDPQANLHVNGTLYSSYRIGIGDSTPETPLYIKDSRPYVRFEDTGGGHKWEAGVFGDSQEFRISEQVGADYVGRLNIEEGGRVTINELRITNGSDLAEPFDVVGAENVKPGMVMVIDPDNPGQLRIADQAYDRAVAGCVSGANGIQPGLTLQQEGTIADGAFPVALTGRVYCWADASYGAIQPGDLLTTSDTPGHIMVVRDYAKAQGAIIGKAMSVLDAGTGLVLVLVALQ
ncbi:MAG: hypothetical protein JXB35_03370 [Anaerolineae bacterium]|nr:hypothetical protein [Anaerolineae bacterium]